MIRSSHVVIESWPLVRLGFAAILIWIGMRFLEAGANVAPYHPGCRFVNGRVPQIKPIVLGSFGRFGEFLSRH